jgi:beta-glucanase (GH16 family)
MNRYINTLCALCVTLAVGPLGTGCGSSDKTVSPERWVLTMSDEFDGEDGSPPSPELWGIETGYGSEDSGWGNDEWQLYTDSPDNVRQEGGNLVITARCSADPCGKRDGSITSARITTQKLFEQKYGRFEARIRLPEGAGLWPAFWMIGANVEEVSWPASGEIDIMENVGREPERVFATVHGPGYSAGNSISNELDLPEGETFADDFHIFAVEWDPARITFSVDGQVQDGVVVGGEVFNIVRSANVSYLGEWVFNNEFFVILNLAVGGTLGGSVDDTAFPAEVLVDYVRFYERAK